MVKEFTDNNHKANEDTQKVAAVIVSSGSVAVIAEAPEGKTNASSAFSQSSVAVSLTTGNVSLICMFLNFVGISHTFCLWHTYG